jgi:hypothetical protein
VAAEEEVVCGGNSEGVAHEGCGVEGEGAGHGTGDAGRASGLHCKKKGGVGVYISGSLLMSAMAARGMPKLLAGPQKSVSRAN